jgi:hypothetical protein
MKAILFLLVFAIFQSAATAICDSYSSKCQANLNQIISDNSKPILLPNSKGYYLTLDVSHLAFEGIYLNHFY